VHTNPDAVARAVEASTVAPPHSVQNLAVSYDYFEPTLASMKIEQEVQRLAIFVKFFGSLRKKTC
jgi:hypothetical protein